MEPTPAAQSTDKTLTRKEWERQLLNKNGKDLVDIEAFREVYPEFNEWLTGCGYLYPTDLLITKRMDTPLEERVSVEIATANHTYTIGARRPYTKEHDDGAEGDPGYLGCIAQVRRARHGERHLRGNDLPDGPYTEVTFTRIVKAIVGYECVPNVLEEA